MSRILALDVGNTSVAAALFEKTPAREKPVATFHRPRSAATADEIAHWTALARERLPDSVVVGSVHRFGAALASGLREALGESVPLKLFELGDQFPLKSDVEEPGRVGVDRLAAALGGFTLARGPALVVSAGTAITVDWVDAGPLFRGGAILPGRKLQAKALHAGTDRLPEIPPWGNPAPLALPGRNTEEAIRRGLDVGLPGMVAAVLADLARAAGSRLPVLVSGGDGEWLAARLTGRKRLEPFLVARGLALAVEAAA
jgi:type III pantothenate kinase